MPSDLAMARNTQTLVGRALIGGQALVGTIEDGRFISANGSAVDLKDARLLSPTTPTSVIGVLGGFQRDDAGAAKEGEAPGLFLKSASSVIGPDEAIEIIEDMPQLFAEGELAAVIGRDCARISSDEVQEHLLGFTIVNDVTVMDYVFEDFQGLLVSHTFRAKSQPTFCPIGPWIATDLGEADIRRGLSITTRVNGEDRVMGNTREFRFPVPSRVVSHASQCTALRAGDIISFGTVEPTPVGAGDVVEIEISGIGTLRNPVVQR